MEFYEPPYMFNGPRPTITSIGETGGPDDEIHYGGAFTITTPNNDDIAMVARRAWRTTTPTPNKGTSRWCSGPFRGAIALRSLVTQRRRLRATTWCGSSTIRAGLVKGPRLFD